MGTKSDGDADGMCLFDCGECDSDSAVSVTPPLFSIFRSPSRSAVHRVPWPAYTTPGYAPRTRGPSIFVITHARGAWLFIRRIRLYNHMRVVERASERRARGARRSRIA